MEFFRYILARFFTKIENVANFYKDIQTNYYGFELECIESIVVTSLKWFRVYFFIITGVFWIILYVLRTLLLSFFTVFWIFLWLFTILHNWLLDNFYGDFFLGVRVFFDYLLYPIWVIEEFLLETILYNIIYLVLGTI